jgi:hypothetical protein
LDSGKNNVSMIAAPLPLPGDGRGSATLADQLIPNGYFFAPERQDQGMFHGQERKKGVIYRGRDTVFFILFPVFSHLPLFCIQGTSHE